MTSKSKSGSKMARVSRRTFSAGLGAVGFTAGIAPFNIVRAAGAPLKVGVLFPRSGFQAGIGQDCKRGVDFTAGILKELGMPELRDHDRAIPKPMSKSLVRVPKADRRRRAAFDRMPSIPAKPRPRPRCASRRAFPSRWQFAAAPALTEQGYKTIFRNFPTGPMIVGDTLHLHKDLFTSTGKTPKTMVIMHSQDTYGTDTTGAFVKVIPKFGMPYKVLDVISYDPAARDLSAEIRKAKATGAEVLMALSRVNDAILLTQEMVKQRWNPMGILSSGPGFYESVYMTTLKFSDDVVSMVPWYDPNKPLSKLLDAALKKRYPHRDLNTNHTYSFEGVMIAVDAYKRAGSTDPGKLIEALRKTDIKDNVVTGPGVHFNAKGQNRQ